MKKCIPILLTCLFLILLAPREVGAQSADSLRSQIDFLLRVVEDLRRQLTSFPGGGGHSSAPSTSCLSLTRSLRIGDRGNDVSKLLTLLHRAGIGSGPSAPWGSDMFDERTASFVVEFQEKYAGDILQPFGLRKGTGFVGVATRAKINALFGCAPSLPPVGQGVVTLRTEAPVVHGVQTVRVFGKLTGGSSVPVSSWVVRASCPSGTVLYGRQNENLCGERRISHPASSGTGETLLLEGSTSFAGPGGHFVGFSVEAFGWNNALLGVGNTSVVLSSAGTLRLISPNGGEVWQSAGRLTDTLAGFEQYRKDITWTGATTASSIDAYLERFLNGNFITVGKIPFFAGSTWIPGIVSIESCFGMTTTYPAGCLYTGNLRLVDPGQYYVRVVDRTTGLSDRSDSAFTLIAHTQGAVSVDLMVNGSNGPLSVPLYSVANLSWTSTNASYCFGSWNPGQSGTTGVFSTGPLTQTQTYTITCVSSAGVTASDTVVVQVGGASGGAHIIVTGPLTSFTAPTTALVTWTSQGVSAVRIEACYNNKSTCLVLVEQVPSSNGYNAWVWNVPRGIGYAGRSDVVIRIRDQQHQSAIFDDLDIPIRILE